MLNIVLNSSYKSCNVSVTLKTNPFLPLLVKERDKDKQNHINMCKKSFYL